MKTTVTTLILLILFTQHIFAQDITQWELPEGAKARLGKGLISGEIAYSPDGTRLAVAGGIGIWLYDTATHQEVALLTGHTGGVWSVAFSPDGSTLASGSSDNTVRIWNTQTGAHIRTLTGHAGWVFSVAFSPDGDTLASGSLDGTVRLWEVNTGAPIRTLTGHTFRVWSVAFSPDGDTLASGSLDGTVRLWEVNTGAPIRTLTGHTFRVWSVAFSPDGNTLASASGDRTVRLWEVNTGAPIRTLTGHTSEVLSVAFSPDGNTLASGDGDDGTVRLWEVATGAPIRTLTGHTRSVFSVAFSPDGNTLASGGVWQGQTVRLWEVATGAPIRTLTGHTVEVLSVAFSPDGNTLASGGGWRHQTVRPWWEVATGTVRLWEVNTGAPIRTLTGNAGSVRSVAFSPDGNTLASGGVWQGQTVRLWEVATGAPIRTLTGNAGSVRSVAFSPDGNTLASGSDDGTVRLWEVNTAAPIRTLTGHTSEVFSVAFSPDGNTLASGSLDGTVRLWEVATGAPIRTLTGNAGSVRSVAFSPDGNTLASGSDDGTVRLWEVATGAHIRTLTEHTAEYGILSVSFSPDGSTLASGSSDTVRIWNTQTGAHIRTLTGHTSWVSSVVFSPDGNTLASGSFDGTILLWELAPSTVAEYRWSIPAGISLIHVPLKVTAVDGVAKTITSIADLYDALGGASTVNFLLTYDPATQGWFSYFGASDTGTSADKVLTDDTGILTGMRVPVSVRLRGNALGINRSSSIILNQGLNLVGLPLRDSRITRVSDLFALEGIGGNVPVIILADGGEFKAVGRADDPGDIEITGGQAFILTAQRAATVSISGEGWHNGSGAAAAPTVSLTGIETRETTPILALRGSVVAEAGGSNGAGFRVTAKNLSTGRVVTGRTQAEGGSYQLIVVDMQNTRAAQIGDILEITAQSADRSIEVQPLRYTVTAEDVKRSQIQLETLIAYEIPAETALLRNYPNPFNPETWIPYHLAHNANVTLTIYNTKGAVVRQLDLGHQAAGYYTDPNKAAYWDGRNNVGERVASGVFFYMLIAGDFSETRKMVILK